MSVSRKFLCVVYALIGLLALVATWSHNAAYLGEGFVAGNLHFWQDTLMNPASTSITLDLFFLGLALNIWMILEARRIGLRFVWLYILAGLLIAISVAFPAFMIRREFLLTARDPQPYSSGLKAGDIFGLLILATITLAFAVWTLLAAAYR
ncbi:MAG: DUF2834 domain-containing protein [Stenotrophobium sp.]